MQYQIPTLYRTKYPNGAILEVPPGIIHHSAGFYVQKGKMKGIINSINKKVVEIDFPEKSLILDEGYKYDSSDELIKWDNEYQSLMVTHGWKLVSQENDTISICLLHNVLNEHELINVISNNHIYTKVDIQNGLYAYDVKSIKTNLTLTIPENHFICVAKGKVSINDLEKKQKFWIRSTSEQEFNIVNMANDESIIFLSKIK